MEAIRAEELEQAPAIYFEIYDNNGETVARVDGHVQRHASHLVESPPR